MRIFLLILLALLVQGCATVDPEFADPRDPWESYNRSMFAFNGTLDKVIVKPVAKGYKAIAPSFVDKGVTNFFENINDITSAANNLLQFKLYRAASDVGRFGINSTIGILGLVDVAGNMNLPKYGEDFGQTLGYWGLDSGPYLMLPIVGPSSARDGVGFVVDWYTDPITYVKPVGASWGIKSIDYIDRRADLVGAGRILEQAALDPYEFIKEAYLQKRLYDVYDGSPPADAIDY